MKRYFLAVHPLIGTKNKPAPIAQMERSPYYWWWAYLRRSQKYLKCCENSGKGAFSNLYDDFGDVRSDDFPSWWGRKTQRGRDLFSEMKADIQVLKLDSPSEWDEDWDDSNVMVAAINMQMGKRKLQQMFTKLLDKHHKGRRGRKALGKTPSSARYPLYRNFSRHNLKTMLSVYDAWYANSQLPKEERKPLWGIGDELMLVPHVISAPNDLTSERTYKHNIMSATVGRHVKNAKAIIANTAKGEFPNSSVD